MRFIPSKWIITGVSVIGPRHQQKGLCNQDSCFVKQKKGYSVGVVSDGLGSHPHSDRGSKAACIAVENAVNIWIKKRDRNEADLLRLIQTYWLMQIRPFKPSECGATCLWVIAWDDGNLLAGRLGDGVIIIDNNDNGALKCLEESKCGFSNQTEALSGSGILSKWELLKYNITNSGGCVCLMTDGISEDLNHEKLNDVIDIFRQIWSCSRRKGRQFIKTELESWTTPGHQDDKTVVVMIKR